ncbi:MAG: AMP-binding protein, partial [Chloroflexi bacterium]|nr:AMP-binding protein [Chloroflexota bacterium]
QLHTWNETTTDFPKNHTIVDLFEQHVATTPDNIAVVFEAHQLTYQELNRQANQLAHYLQSLGVTPEVLVGMCVERSIEMVIGVLGILKAGGAYVPIDPSYPPARITYMLEDSATPLLLTQRHLKKPLCELKPECVVVCLDEVDFAVQETENLVINRGAEDLAYVMYTSGSTGLPKGVMVAHHNLSNFLQDMQHRTGIIPSDKLLAVTTLSFDIAALELYLPLISGSLIYLATRETASDGVALQQLMRHNISFMQATPATWQLLQQSAWQAETPLNILCGGEALSPELANYLLENSNHLWNVYGPTETTVWSSVYPISTVLDTNPLIGQPIANTRIYILDAVHQPQPLGIPGELCIA